MVLGTWVSVSSPETWARHSHVLVPRGWGWAGLRRVKIKQRPPETASAAVSGGIGATGSCCSWSVPFLGLRPQVGGGGSETHPHIPERSVGPGPGSLLPYLGQLPSILSLHSAHCHVLKGPKAGGVFPEAASRSTSWCLPDQGGGGGRMPVLRNASILQRAKSRL